MNYTKAIINVKASLPEDEEIIKIIEICKLEPTNTWRLWTDNNGHNMIIKNNKTITLKKNNRQPIIVKDIYFKSSAKQIANNSKWAMISLAKNKDNANICFLWFLGFDNILRLMCHVKDSCMENKPPLSSGINTLKFIVKNLNVENYKTILDSRYINGPYEGNVVKSWITNWPPSENMQLDMLMTNKTISEKILKDCL